MRGSAPHLSYHGTKDGHGYKIITRERPPTDGSFAYICEAEDNPTTLDADFHIDAEVIEVNAQ